MITAAVVLGLRMRGRDEKKKNAVILWAGVIMVSAELFKIVIVCVRDDPMNWLYNLPLFLCSIQLITIPLAALSKGRIKEASLDFVFIFGLLGALLGTYCAGNIYGANPVLSFDTTVSALTHCISGFSALYIVISGMESMKKKNIPITCGILLSVCILAYTVNRIIDYNYMFLMRGDGTPYDIIYNLLGGSPVLYPISVVLLFFVYIVLFYFAYYYIKKLSAARKPVLTAQM